MPVSEYDKYRQTHTSKPVPSKTHSTCKKCGKVIFAHVINDQNTNVRYKFCPECGAQLSRYYPRKKKNK